jgi:3-deoxy-7-phosphoheptulonate synthase
MIVFLKPTLSPTDIDRLAVDCQGIYLAEPQPMLVLSSKVKTLPDLLAAHSERFIVTASDIQLADKSFSPEKRKITLDNLEFGGQTANCLLMTGPCSVESQEQLNEVARFLVQQQIKVLRAGAFKPRTSPYTFQGKGLQGLQWLDNIRSHYGLKIISEVRDSSHVQEVIDYADMIQIGAKSMYDHGILKACGKTRKPVLLKRGFGTTLQEFVQAAEFVLSSGNPNVILCERGIRTFETKTRFTLDLCGVAWLKEYTNLPIVLDPSHAIGYAYGVPSLAKACLAMGIDGLLIETHPNPASALSDAEQQLNFSQFAQLQKELQGIAQATGQHII